MKNMLFILTSVSIQLHKKVLWFWFCPSFQGIICSSERPGSTHLASPPILPSGGILNTLERVPHTPSHARRPSPHTPHALLEHTVLVFLSESREETLTRFQRQHHLNVASNKKDPESQAAQPGKQVTQIWNNQIPALSHNSLNRRTLPI